MIAAIIQARLSSSRLPHKVLMEVTPGISMLEMVIRKVRLATRVDDIWVTSPDWAVCKVAKHCGAQANWWNKPRDVLGEYWKTANKAWAGTQERIDFVRATADCPLLDPKIIDECVKEYLDRDVDLLYNSCESTGADGSDVEILSMPALERADRQAKEKDEREHPTLFMRRHMNTHFIDTPFEGCSVDTLEDLETVRKILRGS